MPVYAAGVRFTHMTGGRHTKPLFDLVGKVPAVEPRAKPVVRIELRPQDDVAAAREPKSIPGEPVARLHPSPEPEPDAEPVGGTVRLPLNWLYIAAAGVVGLVLLAWIGGVKWGASSEAARTERELAGAFRDRPPLTEPGDGTMVPTGPQNTRSAVLPGSQPVSQPRPENPPTAPAVNQPAGVGQVLMTGGVGPDPREHDRNYLALATLPRADCDAAIAFLGANGVQAIGVPVVDKSQGAANNAGPALFRLVALPGITSEQYRTKQTARTNLEATVARLGEVWQKQYRGASNFARPGWEKFQ